MNEALVAEIMAVEQQASQIREDAEKQAHRVVAKAKDAARTLRKAVRQRAETQADKILQKGKQAAAVERERVVAEAQADAGGLCDLARGHFDRAVSYVVAQVLARE